MLGVGGGFIIVPVIALLFPSWAPRMVTAFSLAVVFANACSGTLAYLRLRRVDVRSAVPFVLAAAPGVILGVFGANALSRGWFDLIFGVLLAFMAGWLAFGTVTPRPFGTQAFVGGAGARARTGRSRTSTAIATVGPSTCDSGFWEARS